MAKKPSKIQIARRISLAVFLGAFTIIPILHVLVPGTASIDNICPFGGLETLYKYAASGEFVKQIDASSIVLLAGVSALAIVLARFFCGWFCAFGALQGVFAWIGKKLFKKRPPMPEKLDKALRWVKYPVLFGILFLTWQAGTLVIRPYDPVAAYGHIAAGWDELWGEFAVGFAVLIVTLVASMFYERAFCKYVCPMGAFTAILSRIPLFRIKREKETCISCSLCDKACPMGVKVANVDRVDSPECISCLECVEACPTGKGTLKASFAGKGMKAALVVAIGAAIYLGALAIGRLSGFATFDKPTLASQAAAGTLQVDGIKGSSTYGDVAAAFGIALPDLLAKLELPSDRIAAGTKINQTAAIMGLDYYETDLVRFAVADLKGIAYLGEDAAAESAQAPAATGGTEASEASVGSIAVPAGYELKGSATVRSLAADLSATEEAVLGKLGLPGDVDRDKPLKDVAASLGIDMIELRSRLAK